MPQRKIKREVEEKAGSVICTVAREGHTEGGREKEGGDRRKKEDSSCLSPSSAPGLGEHLGLGSILLLLHFSECPRQLSPSPGCPWS